VDMLRWLLQPGDNYEGPTFTRKWGSFTRRV
jgi:hypothetical protein